jgi:hypothetical protein
VPGGDAFSPTLAVDGSLPADRFSLAVFPIRNRGRGRGDEQFHTMGARLPPWILSTEFVSNPVHTRVLAGVKPLAQQGLASA